MPLIACAGACRRGRVEIELATCSAVGSGCTACSIVVVSSGG